MRRLRTWCLRFAALFRKERRDRELAEELESHLQMHIEDNLRSGMNPAEARRQALIKLGGVEQAKENYRDRRGIPWFETLLQDIRFGLRMLRKNPGFTAVAVVTLALGIGATAAIFTVVDAVLIRPLPFQGSSRLAMLWEDLPRLGISKFGFSAPDLAFLERAQNSFERLGAFQNKEFEISGSGQPERVAAARVSVSIFPMLGVEPMIGRTFTAEEDAPGHTVALLSYGLWQRRYGADKGIVGRVINLDRQAYTVVGVMPQDFAFPIPGPVSNHEPAEVWLPMAFTPAELQGWGMMYNSTVLARLRPNVTLGQARAEAGVLSAKLIEIYPKAVAIADGGQIEIGVNPFQEEVTGQVRTPLLVLMTAVGFVLLIACANVATLLLARAATRQREIAVRVTLGASRIRILRQLLTESLLLAVGGGAVGFMLAIWGEKLLLSLVPRNVPLPHQISINATVVVFVIGVSILTTVLFGLAPAFQISTTSLLDSLQEGGRGGNSGRAHHRLQAVFVTSEFALALVLLVGAGLLIRSLANLFETSSGFRLDHVLTLRVPLPYEAYPKAAQVREFYDRLFEQLENSPGVISAGLSNDLPLENSDLEGFENEDQGSSRTFGATWVLGNYFQATGIPLVRGRLITPEDQGNSQLVVVISQTLARQYWPKENPIGKRIRWGTGPQLPWRTVVGVVGDVNDWLVGRPVQAHVYMPYSQAADRFVEDNVTGMWRSMNIAVRTQQDPVSTTSALVSQIHSLDPDLAVARIRTMTQVVSTSIAGPKFNTSLLGIFAAMALVLAAIGIYGVLAYVVADRTHEFGIRLALGAQSRDVFRLVLALGMKLAGVGVAIGAIAALGLTHLMAGLLYGVTAADPLTFAGMVGILLVVAVLACWIPARQAMHVDPMVALRHE